MSNWYWQQVIKQTWNSLNICFNLLKKKVHLLSCFANLNRFYESWIFNFGSWISRSDTKHQTYCPQNPLSIHIITLDIVWSWNILSLSIFCLMLIKQVINLRKVRTMNLTFSANIQYQDMVCWYCSRLWWLSNTVDAYFQQQIVQKILKMEPYPVNAGLYMANFSFTTVLAAKFGLIDCNSCQRLFQSFGACASEVAVLFNWNLSRHPFLWLFLLRHQCMTEILSKGMSSEGMNSAFVGNSLTGSLEIHRKFHFQWNRNP